MRWGNCVIYALFELRRQHRAWRMAGGAQGLEPRLCIRGSRLEPSWIWHLSVMTPQTPDGTVVRYAQFRPDDESPLRWWQLWRVIWFRGHVTVGTDSPPSSNA